jgi:M6 family metalloprotease-like protein
VPKTLEGREAIIKEALLYHHKQGVNFKEYDNNGDGVVDYFMVFWTGTDDGWGSFWWGYYTNFTESTFKRDNVTFNKYSWQLELIQSR